MDTNHDDLPDGDEDAGLANDTSPDPAPPADAAGLPDDVKDGTIDDGPDA